jgi:predicted nucleic acid-binding protein
VPPRKERIAVVLDTNVVLGYYLSRRPLSTNSRVFRLWRDERKLQLIISAPIMAEYLEVLVRLKVAEKTNQPPRRTIKKANDCDSRATWRTASRKSRARR